MLGRAGSSAGESVSCSLPLHGKDHWTRSDVARGGETEVAMGTPSPSANLGRVWRGS